MCRGHSRTGVGSLSGMMMDYHQYVYQLYLDNPSFMLAGSVELIAECGLIFSNDTMVQMISLTQL